MRTPSFLRFLLLPLVLLTPGLLFGQFHKPTQEELQMTADLAAPGAAAVYLDYSEESNDPLHFHSVYARIKVLTEKGKELATVTIPYESNEFKVNQIRGRTIHPDGTIVPLVGKPTDLLISKTATKDGGIQISEKVFTLPDVTVGSILEYTYQLNYDDDTVNSPFWEIQRHYFIHKEHFSFTPFKAFLPGLTNQTGSYVEDSRGRVDGVLLWMQVLPKATPDLKANAAGVFNLDLTDIPAIPDEDWMPPSEVFLYRVKFYYSYAHSPTQFWTAEAKLWSKDMDHFAEPSSSIRDAVSSLIAPGDSDLVKARKLYAAVQALDNTDYSRQKSASERKQLKLKAIKHAADVWAQKSGNSNEIALLYLTMLRAAGLTAYDLRVVNRSEAIFDPSYLDMNQFQDDLVILSLNGKEILLDPGEKMCPFQTVSWEHSGAGAVRQSPDANNAVSTPYQSYPDNNTIRIGDVVLDAHGAITGSFRFIMTGQNALYWRQLALQSSPDDVKKQFDKSLQSMVPAGVEAHLDHFLGIDNPNVNLMAIVNVHGILGAATSKRLMLPAFFLEANGSHPFVNQDKRLEPVDMQYGAITTDQVTYHLPDGFSVEGAPADANLLWAKHAILKIKTVSSPGQIIIARTLARAFTIATPEEYQDLRGFYQKIAAADQGELVLKKDASAKGN